MASAIVYDQVAHGAELASGALFEGRKFWVAQRVPHRGALLDLIKANGGEIVPLERHADHMIADPFRRQSPPGTISYDFVHKSIAKGEILDPDDFPAGPKLGTARDPGSLTTPAKGARKAYTPEEDRLLYSWVSDAKARGVPVSGNELYKQLEQKNPSHTWQSWRDRYLKQLQHRPASAFNISDNAPPAPPSDQPYRAPEAPVAKKPELAKNTDVIVNEPALNRSRLVKNKDKARAVTVEEESSNMGVSSSKKETAIRQEYTVDQLAQIFSTEDWESLYAYVEDIDNCDKKNGSYDKAWRGWAESKDNQTVEQWQQYYEKVIRPQWLQDPASKRQQIKKRVEEREQNSSSPTKSQDWSQTQEKAAAASQSIESAPAESPKRTLPTTLPSDSSTAQQTTPQYIRDGYDSALKRIRGQTDPVTEPAEQARPTKVRRRTNLSPTPTEAEEPRVIGIQQRPLEISAADSQQAGGEQPLSEAAVRTQKQEQAAHVVEEGDEADGPASEDDLPGLAALPRPPAIDLEDDDEGDRESVASSTDITHIAPLPRPPKIPEDEDDEDEDELPSNAPTPRATKIANFDTQAILSPSQHSTRIGKLPQPPFDSSPPHHPESDASTTQSLQEFSSYLKENDPYDQPQTQQPLAQLPRPTSPTPSATSELSSSDSSDPDEPLAADEMEDFFTTQHAEGFSDEYITKALKRTRFRPLLAEKVLDAWKHGRNLPDQRGIWAIQEDEEVESGDGAALARLQRKHTLDGWGGITERLNFLRAWERR